MAIANLPLWQLAFAPENGDDELAKLRHELSKSREYAQALENFLFAKYLAMQYKARVEMNAELKTVYQHSADTLADLLGLIFQPTPTRKQEKRGFNF